jgi:hypothetical protein
LFGRFRETFDTDAVAILHWATTLELQYDRAPQVASGMIYCVVIPPSGFVCFSSSSLLFMPTQLGCFFQT